MREQKRTEAAAKSFQLKCGMFLTGFETIKAMRERISRSWPMGMDRVPERLNG